MRVYQEQHYEDVAQLLQRTNGCSLRFTAEAFADLFERHEFAADNPNFDRERFLKACGLEPLPA